MSSWDKSILEIEKLNLSKRSYNCLKVNGINTVMDLIVLSREELSEFRNLGTKSIEEISDFIDELLKSNFIDELLRNNFIFQEDKYTSNVEINNCKALLDKNSDKHKIRINTKYFESEIDCMIMDYVTYKESPIKKIMFHDINGVLSDELNINQIKFSVRATNCLLKSGYKYISQVVSLRKSDLIRIRNMGRKTFEEIAEKIFDISYVIYEDDEIFDISYDEEQKNNSVGYEEYCNEIINEYNDCLINYDIQRVKVNIYLFLKKNEDFFKKEVNFKENSINEIIKKKDVLNRFYNDLYFREVINNHIYNIVASNNKSVPIHNIKGVLPEHIRNSLIENNIISEMINDKKLELINFNLRCYYPTLLEYIDSIKKERERIILLRRFRGETLEQASRGLNITRERVRQIEQQVLSKRPRLRVDNYKEVFEKYNWDVETFVKAYGENKATFVYLNLVYEKGNNSLELFLLDEEIPISARILAEKIIYKNYIKIGSSRIKKEKNEILDYLLRTYCKDEITCREVSDLYFNFLESVGLNDLEEMIYPERYFETKLANSKKILWKFGRRLRYYNSDNIDLGQIVKQLNLEQYKDMEYSTLKFFRDYSELMEEWDIRDEYELHNLIKKKVLDEINLDIKLLKMPHIEFGTANRDMQVLDLLIQNAPIENNQLAMLYEEEYGVKSETTLANYFKCIDEYCHNRVYSIDSESLVGEQFNLMKNTLIKEFYFIADVKKIFNNMFPDGDITLINPYNLKRLGFKLNSNNMYSDKYSNCEQYFRTAILKDDIFDASSLDTKIYFNQTCYHVVQALREQYEIIEFSQNKFINIRRLEKIGISKDILRGFCEEVFDFVGGEFFTIQSLRKRGFEHRLDELGFEDWFYASILKCDYRFKYRRLEGNILFRKGKEIVTLDSLIEYLVCNFRKIDIYDFINFIFEEYGIKIDCYKIQVIARESEMYYDAIMEKIYIDYDEYFEEV